MGGYNQEDNPFLVSSLTPVFLAAFYVGSLYVWPTKHDRDHPDTIKRRFIRNCTYDNSYTSPHLLNKYSIPEIVGLRLDGLVAALVYPLVLTIILFLGPTVVLLTDSRFLSFCCPAVWKQNLQAVLISPLFFGVAHLHHMIERIRKGQGVMLSFLVSLFQFTYTTVFGMYSSLLFVRTGHFVAPFVVHSYCNFMGFPDITEVMNFEPKKRVIISGVFVLGLVSFCYLLNIILEPSMYNNNVYMTVA